MKGINLNKLHRYVGITLAPFLIIQTFSGLFLDFGALGRISGPAGGSEQSASGGFSNSLLVKVHFGGDFLNDCYHILLGIAITWMAISGWLLFLRIRKAQKRSARAAVAEVRK